MSSQYVTGSSTHHPWNTFPLLDELSIRSPINNNDSGNGNDFLDMSQRHHTHVAEAVSIESQRSLNRSQVAAEVPIEQDNGANEKGHRNLSQRLRTIKNKLVCWFRRYKRSRKAANEPVENFHRTVDVHHYFRNGIHRGRIPADVLFDTGSVNNYVRQGWLEMWGIPYDPVTGRALSHLSSRNSRIVGETTMEWSSKSENYKDQIVFLKPATLQSTFLVISDTASNFDLIIGARTFLGEKLHLSPERCYIEDDRQTQGGNSCELPETDETQTKEAKERQATNKELARESRQQSTRKSKRSSSKRRP